uniref:Uncharacterized protein n=1 Tax=Anguilla anguilla TaxID=7936 RepID=A0A0E9X2M0_ANGAN
MTKYIEEKQFLFQGGNNLICEKKTAFILQYCLVKAKIATQYNISRNFKFCKWL